MINLLDKNGNYDFDAVNNLAKENPKLLVVLSEEFYHAQLEKIAESIIRDIDKVGMLLLTGPSSAGKTVTASILERLLEDKGITVHVVSQDNFFLDYDKTPLHPDGTPDLESVECIDFDAFNKFARDIETEDAVSMPVYDFTIGKRSPKSITFEMTPTSLIIMEGIHALNPKLSGGRENIKKAYINTQLSYTKNNKTLVDNTDVRLLRRTLRDLYSRKSSVKKTLDYWDMVLRGEEIYITPYKHLADFKINSSLAYEIMFYAKYLLPLLEINNISPVTEKLIKFLSGCGVMDKSVIPLNSILQEFIAHA